MVDNIHHSFGSQVWRQEFTYSFLYRLSQILKGACCCDPLLEWSRCIILRFQPKYVGRNVSSVSEMGKSMSIWNFTSASFWQWVPTTAPFKDWLLRLFLVEISCHWPHVTMNSSCSPNYYLFRVNDTITCECGNGMQQISGDIQRQCSGSNIWSGSQLTCASKIFYTFFPPPNSINHALLENSAHPTRLKSGNSRN